MCTRTGPRRLAFVPRPRRRAGGRGKLSTCDVQVRMRAGLRAFVLGQQWPTPREYVFDVTSGGQRSSPWPCNSVEVEMKFHSQVQGPFSFCTYCENALNQPISNYPSYVLSFLDKSYEHEDELYKLPFNSFTPKSDQVQISPAASPVILQHTV